MRCPDRIALVAATAPALLAVAVLLACTFTVAMAAGQQPQASPPPAAPEPPAPETTSSEAAAPVTRCLLLVDLSTGETVLREGGEQCAARFSPCSTFKIPNALIGLQTGVLTDENTTFKWNGEDYGREAANRDQTLTSAIQNSIVWYFRRVAEEIGPRRMQTWLDRIEYGNRDISGGQKKFWIMSSLLISADEQVAFMAKFYRNELPFRPEAVATVKKLLVNSDESGAILSGKTGSGEWSDGRKLGWFVGNLKGPKGEYVFAVNLVGEREGIDGRRARDVAKQMLREQGLLP
jgi:bla regulator protein BlaR1